MNPSPKSYTSYAAFIREEVRPLYRLGFCVDDLEQEATFRLGVQEIEEGDPEELDFEKALRF